MRVECTATTHDGLQHRVTPGATYAVIGLEAGWYRILDDQGQPVLLPPDIFRVVDAARPSEWVVSVEDGDEYAYPPELNAPGFFEDLFDRAPDAVRAFARYLNDRLGRVA